MGLKPCGYTYVVSVAGFVEVVVVVDDGAVCWLFSEVTEGGTTVAFTIFLPSFVS